ncbi:MAG: UvrD-helicase domain-containing protein, partial [Bacteroidia bacterium]|nr:UvrD-helicase domain-containing protein [Bacteroidia bacterium]
MSFSKEKLIKKFTEEYETLNEQQRLAVDTIEGPVIVNAGPGTGKTQILALRIGNILQQTDTDPGNI